MFKLIGLWYKSKVMKYRVLTSSADEMHARSEKLGIGGLTLTELGQLHYMGTEMITLAQVAEVAAKAGNKPDEEEPPVVPHGKTGQYL